MNLLILYLLAFSSAFVTAIIALPMWKWWCIRTGLIDEPGERKIHSEAIPLAGGLAVMSGFVIPALIALLIIWLVHAGALQFLRIPFLDPATLDSLIHGVEVRGVRLTAIFLGALGVLVVGLLDDKRELRPAVKFSGQFLIALAVATAGVRITLFVSNSLFSYAITVLWILTVINAFNFMDNMNGLCAGLGAIAAFFLAMTAVTAAVPQYLVALIAFLTCGTLLGFLPYNFPRARAFLGDGGSHLVGYLLAVLAILPHFYTPRQPHAWAVLKPLMILAVPLGDLAWVVVLRLRLGKPFYIGDTNHLSHRLVRAGLTQPNAVALIWFVAAILGVAALV